MNLEPMQVAALLLERTTEQLGGDEAKEFVDAALSRWATFGWTGGGGPLTLYRTPYTDAVSDQELKHSPSRRSLQSL